MRLSPAFLAAGIALFSPYLLAEEVFVSVVGMKQGTFAGELPQRGKGFENKIEALGLLHEMIVPLDAAGNPTGRRQHKPITITKHVGAASPQLFQALVSNELLKNVTIDFTDSDRSVGTAGGPRRLVYQITLQNATVARIVQRLDPPAGSAPVAGGPAHLEEISFTYQSITVTFPGPGASRTASDSMSTK